MEEVNKFMECELQDFYDNCESVFSGIDDKKIVLHDKDVPEMGYIILIGKNISICDTELFLEYYSSSTQFDVFAIADGNIELEFTFYGMMGGKTNG